MHSVSRPEAEPGVSLETFFTWTLVLLGLGFAERTLRYLLAFPLWGDEAFVAMNLLDRGESVLARPLEYDQVVPLGFLSLELAVYRWFGDTERALRLVPYLAGTAGLVAFWGLGERIRRSVPAFPALATSLAVGILAVSYYPVRHGAEVKPYTLDLLLATSLLWLSVAALAEPTPRRLLVLGLFAGAAAWFSYPAALVGGGVSLALAPSVWRHRRSATVIAFGLFNAILTGASASHYLVARALRSEGFDGDLWNYWADAFPPAGAGAFLSWLVDTHSGLMFAYPIGGRDGGSTLTLILCGIGVWTLWSSGRGGDRQTQARRGDRFRLTSRSLMLLLLGPFVTTFLAAIVRLYPYGGSARTSLYLAPSICLLAGVGCARLIGALAPPSTRRRCTVGVFAVLAAIGLVGMARDLWRPYKTLADETNRSSIAAIAGRLGRDDLIVCPQSPSELIRFGGEAARFRWYLRVATRDRVRWGTRAEWHDGTLGAPARLWVVRYVSGDPRLDQYDWLTTADGGSFASRLELTEEMHRCYEPQCGEGIGVWMYSAAAAQRRAAHP